MEANSWPPALGEQSAFTGEAAPAGDWRAHPQLEARRRIVNKIMERLKRRLPLSAVDGLSELHGIAILFEEKIYSAATSQDDYVRKISSQMLSVESKTPHLAPVNSSRSNSGISNHNPAEPAPLGMPSQINQGQSMHTTIVNQASSRQQIVQQNIQNGSTVHGSPSISSSVSTFAGLNQSPITSVGQASKVQNLSGISINAGSTSISQTDIYANLQRQLQGKKITPQIQNQSKSQMFHQQQINQQLLKQNLEQSSISQQQQPHRQSMLQTMQLQSSQQPLMQMVSSLQSGDTSINPTKPGVMQSSGQSGHQQNQLNSVQQPTPLIPQHTQSVGRQQQQVQSAMQLHASSLQQQPTSVTQQSSLPFQHHQQQLIGSQEMSNIQQMQLLGQQTSITDRQQPPKTMVLQQNNLTNVQNSQQIMNQDTAPLDLQQQLGIQGNRSGTHQQHHQREQRFVGSLPSVTNLQFQQGSMHILQQSKTDLHQQQQLQQQNQQTSTAAMQSQGQQMQNQASQQPLVSQFHSQTARLQHLATQLHPNGPRETQQIVQDSGTLLSQGAVEQKKPFVKSQRGIPDATSTLGDSTAQTWNGAAGDWQEEIYQKLKCMKELYFAKLKELFQRIVMKLQQYDASPPMIKQTVQYDKLKGYKVLLESKLNLLQLPKDNIPPGLKDKIHLYEQQIISILDLQKKQQPGVQQSRHSGGNAQSLPQQHLFQVPQPQQPGSSVNHVKQMNVQSSSTSIQSAAVPTSQLGSMPISSQFDLPTNQQNLTNAVPSTGRMNQVHFDSIQQGAIGSTRQSEAVSGQSTVGVPQQNNTNTISSQLVSDAPQPQISGQQQQQMQEQNQHMVQTQQTNQPQPHLQQQLTQQQKQTPLQTQQPLQPQSQQYQKQQQTTQMPTYQSLQFHEGTETNELKMKQGSMVNQGAYQQHYSGGQSYNLYQQFKHGAAFPISSPQNLPSSSPQISHHCSPQIEQQSMLSSQLKLGTLQSSASPFAPSPSTSLAPSPMPADSEKPLSGISPLPNTGHVGNKQSSHAPSQVQSMSVTTPGMSASPLLAEFTGPDGNQASMPTAISSRTSEAERPLVRLLRLVHSSSPKNFKSAVNDIGSVVSMTDRIAGSAPGNGSRTAVGEDLVAMTKCRLQGRNSISEDGSASTKNMVPDTSAMQLTNLSSDGSLNDSFIMSYGLEPSKFELTATLRVKRQKVEVNYALIEEVREINRHLIDTMVNICEDESCSMLGAPEGEGTIVKCSYTAIALGQSLKKQFASAQLSPIVPLRLLVPAAYPNCSPTLLDELPPDEPSRESDDLSTKARAKFSIALRNLTQPTSLGEIVRTWDACTREVITEYAQRRGGGSFSSTYGTWENCIDA